VPLFIVPTPIGNLGDITLRALETLKSVDAIACEDTRRTLKLLNHYGIRKPLVSYHRHNERSRAEEVLSRLERGESIALVSDAGTPGISDPGYALIEGAISRGFEVDALPGANAVLPALLLSGLSAREFYFVGFVDGSAGEIESALKRLADVSATLIFYVAPHDLAKFLEISLRAFGDRRAAIAREMSKVHRETIRGTLSELIGRRTAPKGEMTLVVEAAPERGEPREDWRLVAAEMKKNGIWDKEIANVLFASYGIPRNRVKNFLSREESCFERD
jgi:16S rRNA (cytidine1402-2'-O)-methyltransferase